MYAGVIGTGNEPPRSQTAAVVGAFGLSDRTRTRTDQPYRLAAAGEPDRDLTGSPRSARSVPAARAQAETRTRRRSDRKRAARLRPAVHAQAAGSWERVRCVRTRPRAAGESPSTSIA